MEDVSIPLAGVGMTLVVGRCHDDQIPESVIEITYAGGRGMFSICLTDDESRALVNGIANIIR